MQISIKTENVFAFSIKKITHRCVQHHSKSEEIMLVEMELKSRLESCGAIIKANQCARSRAPVLREIANKEQCAFEYQTLDNR